MNVAILGASTNPERYSYKAFKQLQAKEYKSYLISPNYSEIAGERVYKSLSQLSSEGIEIDTLTIYVSEKISSGLATDIKTLSPNRVIFNPGSENAKLEKELANAGIKVEQACTLVLLSTDQF